MPQVVSILNVNVLADEDFTVSTTVLSPASTNFNAGTATNSTFSANSALVTCNSESIRYRFGTDPTASTGHLMSAGDSLVIEGSGAIRRFRMIRAGATDADVFITYFG